jgi:hypothetical protein
MSARIETGIGVSPASLPANIVAPPVEQPPPAVIARHHGEDVFSYAALRERAVAWVQALSGEPWTDFNYHDPGVTLLEALCYALTEDVFEAQQPLVDLLTASDGHLHYRRLGLQAAEAILPCRPCTAMDYVLWLLDRVPGVLQAHAAMPNSQCLWRLELETTTADAAQASVAAVRAYWAQRNLGEDIEALPTVLQSRWCSLQLDLSVEGTRAPEDILAELVARCADYVDAAPRRESLMERMGLDGTLSLADAFDGPRMLHGWIDTDSLVHDLDRRVYFGDLARIAQAIDGVGEVRRVGLVAEDMDDSSGALPRRGDDWVLRLRWPDAPAALADWRITRRGTPVALAIDPLLHRLDDLRRATGGRAPADSAPHMPGSPLARPQGQYLPLNDYVSLYRNLPRIYRERFEAALPSTEFTYMAQFKGYLALLEQWLAHGIAQTHHLRELYTLTPGIRPSYAWQMLGDEHIPGLSGLYATDRESVREAVFAPADNALERRGRVLDHLLALYGESCGQASIAPFGWYFGADDWRRHLFERKRLMLRRIVTLTRERYGGIDYSRRSLGRRGNTAVFQQRVSLLLAFKHYHARLLMPAMSDSGLELASETATFNSAEAAPSDSRPLALWSAGRRRVLERLGDDLATAVRVMAYHFPGVHPRTLPPALLRCAVHAERYQHVSTDTHKTVWLGPDENGRWWPLRLRSPRISAETAAICLHEMACRLQLECEGMHLVEHVLLRPLDGSDPDVPEDFYARRLTAVFSGWTARGRDPSFRRVAEETLALNAPAHLRVTALWLDAAAMQRFERSFAAWLEAKQAHCAAWLSPESETAALARLESWSRMLRWLLSQAWPASQGDTEGAA